MIKFPLYHMANKICALSQTPKFGEKEIMSLMGSHRVQVPWQSGRYPGTLHLRQKLPIQASNALDKHIFSSSDCYYQMEYPHVLNTSIHYDFVHAGSSTVLLHIPCCYVFNVTQNNMITTIVIYAWFFSCMNYLAEGYEVKSCADIYCSHWYHFE